MGEGVTIKPSTNVARLALKLTSKALQGKVTKPKQKELEDYQKSIKDFLKSSDN